MYLNVLKEKTVNLDFFTLQKYLPKNVKAKYFSHIQKLKELITSQPNNDLKRKKEQKW